MYKGSEKYQELTKKLDRVENRQTAVDCFTGGQRALLLVFGLGFLLVLLEALFRFNVTTRTVLFYSYFILSTAAAFRFFLLPLWRRYNPFGETDYFGIARKTGGLFPNLRDDLLNAMQLIPVKSKKLYSAGLIDAAFKRVHQKSANIKFEKAIRYDLPVKMLRITLPVIAAAILMTMAVPTLSEAAYRLWNFNTPFIPPPEFQLTVTPGDKTITKGEDVTISVNSQGKLPASLTLYTKDETETDFNEISLQPDSTGTFTYDLFGLRSSVIYYAGAGSVETPLYRLTVINRPVIRTFSITVTPPSYSALPSFEQKDNGNITALPGSRVEFKVSASKPLKEAYLFFSDSSRIALDAAGNSASSAFNLSTEGAYQIIITDQSNNRNDAPITYTISLMTDRPPTIEMIQPGKHTDLTTEQRIALLSLITDDYGFSKLLLHYRLSASKYETPVETFTATPIQIDGSVKENEISYIWNVSKLGLATEDEITYFLEVYDNDIINGPKSARTEFHTLRLPSIDELFNTADEAQKSVEQQMAEAMEEAEALRKDIEQIDRNLKQDQKEITWEEKENIQKSLEKYEQLQEKMNELSDSMNETRENLQENNLLSKETLEKYMELQELMDTLTSDEMKEAMERLRETMDQMNRKQTQDAFSEMQMDEEQFRKSIERTMNLMKRIMVEQKMDELVKRSEEMLQQQDKLSEATEEAKEGANQEQTEALQQQQQEIEDKMNSFEQAMEELKERMSELENMPMEALEQLKEQMEQQQNQQLSEQVQQQMQQQQMQQAMQTQQQMQQNMQQNMQSLQEMQEQMMQQNQMETFAEMVRIIENLVSTSQEQEGLKNELERQNSTDLLKEEMRRQNNLRGNMQQILSQMSELSQKTFAITPEMGKALGDAGRQMDQAMEFMQGRNNQAASMSQGQAMKGINEAAMLMQQSMNQMMQQGGSGGGMMSLMQQLQQLSGQQMQLNNMTQQLQQAMQQGQLSPQQQQQLQRLGQQQELIRKSVEQLTREAEDAGKSKSIAADLDKVMQEMQEVISDMNTEKLDDPLVQKQERILSRLLEAQRSMNERDFEKERESNSAANIAGKSPAELQLQKEIDVLRDELNRAVREGYSKDYEELIRRYYETIRNSSRQN